MKNGDVVTMQFPLNAEYIMPVRLALSGIAARMGMSVDDIEDLRTAVSEACVWAMDGMEKGDLFIEANVGNSLCVKITVRGQRIRPRNETEGVLEISRMMIDALCRESSFMKDGVSLCFAVR